MSSDVLVARAAASASAGVRSEGLIQHLNGRVPLADRPGKVTVASGEVRHGGDLSYKPVVSGHPAVMAGQGSFGRRDQPPHRFVGEAVQVAPRGQHRVLEHDLGQVGLAVPTGIPVHPAPGGVVQASESQLVVHI